jgi:hypothetical protein
LRYLSLHILNNNVDNKNIDEIKASQKQQVTIPKDYHELIAVMEMDQSLSTILFGNESALLVKTRRAITPLKTKVSTIKVRIASNYKYPAKILYAFKIRIQCWLLMCEQQDNRSSISDRIINMDPVIKHILNSSLTIDLPPVFTGVDPTQTNVGGIIAQAAAAGQQQEGDKRVKKRKECDGAEATKQYIKNKSIVNELKMKENEVWKRDLAGKNLKDRPKWNNKS